MMSVPRISSESPMDSDRALRTGHSQRLVKLLSRGRVYLGADGIAVDRREDSFLPWRSLVLFDFSSFFRHSRIFSQAG